MKTVHLSVVIPLFNEEEIIPELYKRVNKTMKTDFTDYSYELIFVDDGSIDQSFNILTKLQQNDKTMRVLQFSRNFGHHIAIKAGLDNARGDFTILMDADLQDQPEDFIKIYNKLQEGYDIVMVVRENRQDPLAKKITSKLFFKIMNYLSNITMLENQSMLRIFNKKVLQVLQKMDEIHQNNGAFLAWIGFKIGKLYAPHHKRAHGTTKYNFRRALKFAIDTILGFSNKPLIYISLLGICISFFAFIGTIYILHQRIFNQIGIPGWPSLMILTAFLGGMIMFALGVVGLYIGRLYQQSLHRPLYIIANKLE